MLPWFFLTPIVYASEVISNPAVRNLIFYANPMASLVTHYRQIIYFGRPPDLTVLAWTAAEALLALLIGLAVFQRLNPHFVDEL
jgi:ABC-type polysaccharide/polyol phosphate export permease